MDEIYSRVNVIGGQLSGGEASHSFREFTQILRRLHKFYDVGLHRGNNGYEKKRLGGTGGDAYTVRQEKFVLTVNARDINS